MKYKFLLILSFICLRAFPQSSFSSIGARSAAMASASLCLSDLWAVNNNQASLSNLKSPQAGVYYENRFQINELGLRCFAFAMPIANSVIGFSVNNFGFNLYNENKLGIAYSKNLFKNLSAGIQIDYFNTRFAENYENINIFTFEGGFRADISEKFAIASHIFNPIKVNRKNLNQPLSSALKVGCLYSPSSKIIIAIEADKDMFYQPVMKIGIEYNPLKNIFFRTGVSTLPEYNSFGFGINSNHFIFDFSSSLHQILGFSHQFSIIYNFRKSK